MLVRVLPQYIPCYFSKSSGKPAFRAESRYFVFGFDRNVESDEEYVILASDQFEVWWVDAQHVQPCEIMSLRIASDGPYLG